MSWSYRRPGVPRLSVNPASASPARTPRNVSGNWYLARSTDGGVTWSFVAPWADISDFCCDQEVLHGPRQGLVPRYARVCLTSQARTALWSRPRRMPAQLGASIRSPQISPEPGYRHQLRLPPPGAQQQLPLHPHRDKSRGRGLDEASAGRDAELRAVLLLVVGSNQLLGGAGAGCDRVVYIGDHQAKSNSFRTYQQPEAISGITWTDVPIPRGVSSRGILPEPGREELVWPQRQRRPRGVARSRPGRLPVECQAGWRLSLAIHREGNLRCQQPRLPRSPSTLELARSLALRECVAECPGRRRRRLLEHSDLVSGARSPSSATISPRGPAPWDAFLLSIGAASTEGGATTRALPRIPAVPARLGHQRHFFRAPAETEPFGPVEVLPHRARPRPALACGLVAEVAGARHGLASHGAATQSRYVALRPATVREQQFAQS